MGIYHERAPISDFFPLEHLALENSGKRLPVFEEEEEEGKEEKSVILSSVLVPALLKDSRLPVSVTTHSNKSNFKVFNLVLEKSKGFFPKK